MLLLVRLGSFSDRVFLCDIHLQAGESVGMLIKTVFEQFCFRICATSGGGHNRQLCVAEKVADELCADAARGSVHKCYRHDSEEKNSGASRVQNEEAC